MLKSLYIKNYILIDELTFEPSKRLNTITGATGAGKSILLNSLKLLTGARFHENKFFDNKKKCILEAKFDISSYDSYSLKNFFIEKNLDYDDEPIIRREIDINGRSRSFVNDTPIKLADLKIIMSYFIDIHGQYDNLLAKDSIFQLQLIDIYADNAEIKEEYKKAFKKLKKLEDKYDEYKRQYESLSESLDYKKYLLNELQEANLENIDQNALESKINVLDNAEMLKYSLKNIYNIIENEEKSSINQLYKALNIFEKIGSIAPKYNSLLKRLDSCTIEIKDVASEIFDEENKIEINENLLQQLKAELDSIYSLFNKHKVNNLNDLKIIYNNLKKELSSNEDIEEKVRKLETEISKYKVFVMTKAERLSKSRSSVLNTFVEEIKTLLKELDLKKADIKINLSIINDEKGFETFTEEGIDKVKILFSANKGHKLNELKDCASGGEISRLMLCFKYITGRSKSLTHKYQKYPTIIFDEIDTGISGEVAIKIAKMIKKMSQDHQILVITHLPQVAAIGDFHFLVYKFQNLNTTKTAIKNLAYKERIREIAKMIEGDNPSHNALKTAEQLILSYKNEKFTKSKFEADPASVKADSISIESTPISFETNPTSFEINSTAVEANPTSFEINSTSFEANPTSFEINSTAVEANATIIEANSISLEANPTSRKETKVLKEMHPLKEPKHVLTQDGFSLSEMPIYKLVTPKSKKNSFILLANNTCSNIIKVPESVFELLDECKEISFEYNPRLSIAEEAKSNFKSLIDNTIYIIEVTYHIMTKLYNSSNFDIYISLISEILDKHRMMLDSYTQIMKVRQRLGSNINYIMVSAKNIGFGMIDPGGCLLLENNQFNYKKLAFKPLIALDKSLKNSISKDSKNIKYSVNDPSKYIEQIVSLDIISKWISKIMDEDECLFVIGTKYFSGSNGIKQKLENIGYKLTKMM